MPDLKCFPGNSRVIQNIVRVCPILSICGAMSLPYMPVFPVELAATYEPRPPVQHKTICSCTAAYQETLCTGTVSLRE